MSTTATITTVVATVTMVLTMTACHGSPSGPAAAGALKAASTPATMPTPAIEVSAAAACRDFGDWYASAGGPDFASTEDLGSLVRADAEAPRGQLHKDLSALITDVIAAQSSGSRPGRGRPLLMQSAAYAVEQACVVVNSSSFPL